MTPATIDALDRVLCRFLTTYDEPDDDRLTAFDLHALRHALVGVQPAAADVIDAFLTDIYVAEATFILLVLLDAAGAL